MRHIVRAPPLVTRWRFSRRRCAPSIRFYRFKPVMLILVLVLVFKDSLRTKFKSLSRVRFAGWLGEGFNPPNVFWPPPRVSVDSRRFWGSILTPVLVLHVSACGASTLLPDGDPLHANPMQLLYVQPDVLSKRSPTMEPRTFRHLLPRTWQLQVGAVED